MSSHQDLYIKGKLAQILGALDHRTVPTEDEWPLFLATTQILPAEQDGDYYLCRYWSGGHVSTSVEQSRPRAFTYVQTGLLGTSGPGSYGMIFRCFKHPGSGKTAGGITLIDGAIGLTASSRWAWRSMQEWMEPSERTKDLASKADEFASLAHAGQKDEIGCDYIDHSRRVALRSANIAPEHLRESATAAALLQDTVEDTEVTLEDLCSAGFTADVITAVTLLTKTPGQTPDEHFKGVRSNRIAKIVKTADLIDNSDPNRLVQLEDATRERLRAKYARSWQLLLGADEPIDT